MVAGTKLWLGTGKGVVLIFSVSGAVPETEAAIARLAQNTNELAVATEAEERGSCGAGHGLVTAGLAGEGASQEIHLPSIEPTWRRNRSDYYRNRRTAFGRTLRGPSMRQVQRSPAVFQLQYESSYQLVQAESVRVLLSMW